MGHRLVEGQEHLQISSRRAHAQLEVDRLSRDDSSITLPRPVQRNSREREAIGLPVAFACPVWRWGAGDHIKAPLHIMGQVDMWLHSNHHQPTKVCSMQAVLLISSLVT